MRPLNDRAQALTAGLSYACLALAVWFTACFLFLALSTLQYPYGLEWMEGQSVDVVQRILSGESVYAKPTLDYVAFIYTPLYYYLSALISLVTGLDFFPCRLVSFIAAIGIGALIYSWLRRDGASWLIGLLGAGLFFATYKISGRWFDLARVDSLFLCLTLAGLYVFYHYRSWRYALLSALCLSAAFFTKQTALLMAAPVLLASLFLCPTHALRTCLITAILTGAGILLYNWSTGGWFNFFVFTVPAGHPYGGKRYELFWLGDIEKIKYLLLLAAIALICLFKTSRQAAVWYGALLCGGILAAFVSRIHSYASVNVLMPMYAALALASGMALARIEQKWLRPACLALILAQFASLIYDPQTLMPTPELRQAGDRFLSQLSKLDGDIFMPEIQFIQTRVHKKSYALGMAAYDVTRSELGPMSYVKAGLREQIRDAMESGRFSYVAAGHFVFQDLPGMDDDYRPYQTLDFPGGFVTGEVHFMHIRLWQKR